MNEGNEVPKGIDVGKKGGPEKKKSLPQGIKEKAALIWNRFKEATRVLLGKADERLAPVNKKAEEIGKKTKTESLKDYFKTQIENFKDGIQERIYDIYGAFYEIGAGVSQAKVFFWHNFMGGMMQNYLRENQENVKRRKEKAKENYEKAKVKAKENREKRDKLHKGAKEIREKKITAV